MDHLIIHHLQEYNAVVVSNTKKVSLTPFISQRQVSRVCVLLQGNGPPQNGTDTTGVSLHEQTMTRWNALEVGTKVLVVDVSYGHTRRSKLRYWFSSHPNGGEHT